jgi:hypothetical protein
MKQFFPKNALSECVFITFVCEMNSNKNPERLLWLLLGSWWAVNLLQAAFTQLANDEAYYFIFSLRPAWGYFDHPPLTAWLVWLGTYIFGTGELGVRFFPVLLQPLYLWMFWRAIRPAQPDRGDVALYAVICAAVPILQLYGIVAVPDGPLMFSVALFLLCYKRFTGRETVGNALLLGFSIALMAYAKYHGALVVFFTLLSNPRLLLRWRAWAAVAFAGALMIPHLRWQAQNDWVSMGYHLTGRNRVFSFDYISSYLLNLLAVFNPLFWSIYVRAWIASRSRGTLERAVCFIGAGLFVFFLLSSIRGYVQPQWTIAAAFMLVMLLFGYARRHPRTRRYIVRAGAVTVALVALFRIEMIFNPLNIRFEIFDNEESYGAIAARAAGRPVIFNGNYAIAAKYIYYTGQEAYCQPDLYYRSSQWQLTDYDTRMAGREVLAQVWRRGGPDMELANGMAFNYEAVKDFRPVRLVGVTPAEPFPAEVSPGEEFDLKVVISNPYPHDIRISPDSISLNIVWGVQKLRDFHETTLPVDTLVGARGELPLTLRVVAPRSEREYDVGFTLRNPPVGHWYNSPRWKVKLVEPKK